MAIVKQLSLLGFLKEQLPRLQQAILERHHLPLSITVQWLTGLVALQALAAAASILFLGFGFNLVEAVKIVVMAFLGAMLSHVILCGGLGLWVKRSYPHLQSDEWIEFYFLCVLPAILASFLLLLPLPELTGVVILLAQVWSFALLYIGLQKRFQNKQPWVVPLAFVAFLIISNLMTFFGNNDWGKIAKMQATYEHAEMDPDIGVDQWTPQLPGHMTEALQEMYPNNKQKSKAVMQYANAVWQTLGPASDNQKSTEELIRAGRCLVQMGVENKSVIKGIVLQNPSHSRRYLEVDATWHGRILPNPKGPACD